MSTSPTPNKTLVVAAIVTLYFVWGSTYLALRFGLEGFPPFLLNGLRFLLAGALLWLFIRKRFSATRSQIVNAAKVGSVMLMGGVGLVTLAEHAGIGSAVAASAIAVTPVWVAVSAGIFGSWPGRREWIGLAIGLIGVLILAREGDFQASPLGLALIVISPMIWSFASVWGTKIDLPDPLSNTAVQLLAGGLVMTLAGLVGGEWIVEMPSMKAWAAMLYLAVFGSLLAYTAFVYLMHNVRPSLATSYAYVNPIVAVILGVTLGDETLTGAVFFALPLILTSVALVATRPRMRSPRVTDPQPVDQAA
ncbi:MAG: drug/metabolite exporter YedA [Acidimicrobiales bacterium]|nr:drug/metabolite exporter YedA [Acidimicrobiales bacterium]